MIVGIVTFIMALFGGGSVDVFYIDKIEQGINKEITDKDRKKELKTQLKDYSKASKEFNKSLNKHIKELKSKNLQKSTDMQWYEDYFDVLLDERIELQKNFIEERLKLQENITDDEWDGIMKRASDEATKLAEKEEKKESKKKDKNAFAEQEKAIVTHVADQDRRMIVLEALGVYEELYMGLGESYEMIDVNQSDVLADKYASSEEMMKIAELLNEIRIELYEGYMVFILSAQNNTTEEEYVPVMKAFNKSLEY